MHRSLVKERSLLNEHPPTSLGPIFSCRSSARNLICGVDPSFVQAATILGWSNFVQGMKPLSWPSQFSIWQQRAVVNNFHLKELFHVLTQCLKRLFVAAATTLYQESHFWAGLRTEELFAFLFWPENFWIHCNTWSKKLEFYLSQYLQYWVYDLLWPTYEYCIS